MFFSLISIFLCSLANGDKCSALNLGGGLNGVSTSHNLSRTHSRLISLLRLPTFWIGAGVLKRKEGDNPAQYSQSSKLLLVSRQDVGGNHHQSIETNPQNASESSPHRHLMYLGNETLPGQTLQKGPPGVNTHPTRNTSRQYFALHNLGLILNLPRVLEHGLSAGIKGVPEVSSNP